MPHFRRETTCSLLTYFRQSIGRHLLWTRCNRCTRAVRRVSEHYQAKCPSHSWIPSKNSKIGIHSPTPVARATLAPPAIVSLPSRSSANCVLSYTTSSTIKQSLMQAPVLAIVDQDRPFLLVCIASDFCNRLCTDVVRHRRRRARHLLLIASAATS